MLMVARSSESVAPKGNGRHKYQSRAVEKFLGKLKLVVGVLEEVW